jgi:stage V sporulation protein SpoVS
MYLQGEAQAQGAGYLGGAVKKIARGFIHNMGTMAANRKK